MSRRSYKTQFPCTSLSRKGTVYIIAICLLGFLGLMVFALSMRFREHTGLETIADRSKTARFFLESQVGEVLLQLRTSVNDPSSKLFKLFRNATLTSSETDVPLSDFYTVGPLLNELESYLPYRHSTSPPKIRFLRPKLLNLPEMFDTSSVTHGEYSADLEIESKLSLENKVYSLKVSYPFKMVMLLSPLIREFLLFCDQLHLEQSAPFGSADKINIVVTKDGTCGFPTWPLVLGPCVDAGDADRLGKVFLGADDQPIFLNLAGEKYYRGIRPDGTFDQGTMSELWMVPSQILGGANPDNLPYKDQGVFQRKDGSYFHFRSVYVEMDACNIVKMGILGFSDENVNTTDGHFANVAPGLKFHEMMAGDPSFEKLRIQGGDKAFTVSSAFKLFGWNNEIKLRPDELYTGPRRNIYGDVFGRFFQLSYFSSSLDPTNKGHGVLKYGTSSPFSYFQPFPGTQYPQYMTKTISGGNNFSPGTPIPADFFPMNKDKNLKPQKLGTSDFKGTDGLRIQGKFTDLSSQWFRPQASHAERQKEREKSIWGRVSREFPTQDQFKKFVGYSSKRFWVDGVVYIKGNLDLLDGIDFPDVKGGIVLVDGDITLGNITQGVNFSHTKELNKAIQTWNPAKILTFVSVSQEGKIKIEGQRFFGVQLVKLFPNLNGPVSQIEWKDNTDDRQFFGSIVVSTPCVEKWVQSFRPDPPYLHFIPSMADADPPTSIQVDLNPRSYDFSVE